MTAKKEITTEMRAQLRKDFPDEAIKQHPTKKYLSTIKAMYVTERLNDVFGVGRWELKTELVVADNTTVVVKGKLVSNYWDFQCTPQFGGHTIGEKDKMDLADCYKSAVTDCMGKVASLFEVGISVFKGQAKPSTSKKPAQNRSYSTVTQQGQTVQKFRITCQTCGNETESKFQNAKQCYPCWKKSN